MSKYVLFWNTEYQEIHCLREEKVDLTQGFVIEDLESFLVSVDSNPNDWAPTSQSWNFVLEKLGLPSEENELWRKDGQIKEKAIYQAIKKAYKENGNLVF